MIIFWKIVFVEDIYLFGSHDNSYSGDVSYPGNQYNITTTDKTVNYLVGTGFLVAFLLSTTLNPLLLYCFQQQKHKVRRLFQMLAIGDFLTNLITPVVYSVIMFR